jgi:hypothetical protein
MDRPKEIGSLPEILDRELKEERLTRLAFLQFLLNGAVVFSTVGEGVIEDGRIRGEPGNGKFLNVAAECALHQ